MGLAQAEADDGCSHLAERHHLLHLCLRVCFDNTKRRADAQTAVDDVASKNDGCDSLSD